MIVALWHFRHEKCSVNNNGAHKYNTVRQNDFIHIVVWEKTETTANLAQTSDRWKIC